MTSPSPTKPAKSAKPDKKADKQRSAAAQKAAENRAASRRAPVAPPPPAASGPSRFGPSRLGPARFGQVQVREKRSPLKVLGSALALLVLLVGIPVGLYLVSGPPPVPHSWPDRATLTQPIGVAQIVTLLIAIVWLAWLQFAVSVAVELVAALRGGVLAAPIPLAGPSQRLARTLVAGLLVSAVLAVHSAAVLTPPRDPAVVTALADPSGSGVGAPSGTLAGTADAAPVTVSPQVAAAMASSAIAPPAGVVPATAVLADEALAQELAGRKVYVVAPAAGRHHDSLWEIAERHLGDGRRYKEIYALNHGRVQHDGRSLELARLIQPGWILVMPEDAVGVERIPALTASLPDAPAQPAPSGQGSAPSAPSATDAATDAATDVATPAATPAAAPSTAGVPSAAASPSAVPALPTPEASTAPPPASVSAPTSQVSGEHVTEPPAVALPAPAAPAQGQPPAAQAPAPAPAPDLITALRTPVAAMGGLTPIQLAGFGLLGAGLLNALVLARRRGRPSQPSEAAVEAEVWLRVGADPNRAKLLESSLHVLRDACEETRTPLPQVYAATVDDQAVTLMLAPPVAEAPAPWTVLDDGARWRLHRSEVPRSAGRPTRSSPLPGLVSLGRDVEDRDVLADLRIAGGPVCITGDPAVAVQVVRALALELATNPWSSQVRVTAVDLPVELGTVGNRLDVPADPADPLAGLRDRVAHDSGANLFSGAGSRPADGPLEHVVFGTPPAREVGDELRRLGSAGGLGILVAGDVPGARWRFVVDSAGTLTAPELGLTVLASRVDDASLAALGDLFAAAAGRSRSGRRVAQPTPAGGIGGASLGVPSPPVAVDDGAWAVANARIGLLGPVLVRAPGALDPSRLDLAAELVAYLALHPDGVHPTVLAGALWPRGVTTDVRDATIDRVRDWLGQDETGAYRLLRSPDDRLRLSPSVVVDWHVVCTLLTRAGLVKGHPAERELLARALRLVRGPLAGGPVAGQYSWLARTPYERQVPEVVTAAAHRLSGLCLPADPPAAVEAARCGLRVDPVRHELWRDLVRAEHAQWGADGVRQVAAQMAEVLTGFSCDAEPETLALLDDLAPGASALVV